MEEQPDTKFQKNEIVYPIDKNDTTKGVIEEIILHYTQKNRVVKYIVRPYGRAIDACVAIDEENLVETYEEAQHIIKKRLEILFKQILDKLMNTKEEVFDKVEAEYQKKIEVNTK